MKKVILTSILFASVKMLAQIPVTDAAAGAQMTAVNTSLMSQLSTAGNQLTQLEKSYEMMEKSAEKIEKVNSMVEAVSDMKEIISLNNENIKNVQFVLKNLGKNKKQNVMYMKKLSGTVTAVSGYVSTLNKLMSSNFFSMTDKERLDYFKELRTKVIFQVGKSRGIANQFRK
jgi:Type IV secretion system proteins